MLFYVLVVLGLGHCDDLPSRLEVESSINRTIVEVERLMREDSTLPRLNRSEIVNILYNITSRDLSAYKNQETIEEARKIYQRALMLVLPYNAEDTQEDIENLFTKPPIVKMVADSSSSLETVETWESEELITSTQETPDDNQSLENLVVSEKSIVRESSQNKTRYKNHRETYSDVHTKIPLKETLKFDSAPIKFSFNLDNLQKQQTTTINPTTTRRPVFQKSSSAKDEKVHIVYSTSATIRTMNTSPKNVQIGGIDKSGTTSQTTKQKQNVLSSDQWRYNAPPVTTERTIISTKAFNLSSNEIHDKQPFLPTVNVLPEDSVIITPISKTVDIPKIISKETKVVETKQTPSNYVTPPSSSASFEKSKYGSTYTSNSGGFRRITTTTTTIRPEVMDLLASIGLRPENSTNVEDVFKKNKDILENKFQVFNPNMHTTVSGLTDVTPDSSSIVAQNTFVNPVSEIGKGMSNLSPDVQLLFQQFGLKTSNSLITTTSTPSPTITSNSYTNFKPLPTSRIKDQDMREFLAKFGLGVNDNRQQKGMRMPTERPSLIEAVPSDMRPILENIGLISRKIPKTTQKTQDIIKPTEASRLHVFKPHEVYVKDEKQRLQILELLDTIKLVQEGKAHAKDVRKVADDLLVTTKKLQDGPDPLSLEEIIRIYNEDLKNEVKRQEGQEKPTETATTATTTISTTTANGENLANISTTSFTNGIKRFMISVLSVSEFWVRKFIQGLTRIRYMLNNMGN